MKPTELSEKIVKFEDEISVLVKECIEKYALHKIGDVVRLKDNFTEKKELYIIEDVEFSINYGFLYYGRKVKKDLTISHISLIAGVGCTESRLEKTDIKIEHDFKEDNSKKLYKR